MHLVTQRTTQRVHLVTNIKKLQALVELCALYFVFYY